ncbi:hypothetical protein PMI09_04424 [Rhizobium sp. CF122]|uniref:hypothetical protein n=1 Tax=Rhizobium sp. CF122 TaxID=1144312 RepID=UPI000271B1F5|nr:hypothetical protein [Rhizobium sp. CF122]EJL51634.1 hypothetical protein PMI09_04424 [Rhizobium sp. CF122]
MANDPKGPNDGLPSIDKDLGINIKGITYFPLKNVPSVINPCAGKTNGTSCGPGCICQGGQCYYTLFKIQEMGIKFEE